MPMRVKSIVGALGILLFADGGFSQTVQRPPPAVVLPVTPPVTAPPLRPLTPSVTVTPAPALTPAPAVPVQVVPPPAVEPTTDPPDGSDSCDCYEEDREPVYANGEIVGWNPMRRWTGQSSQCCPQQ